MTREEAKKVLNTLKDETLCCVCPFDIEECNDCENCIVSEALDIAIEALEQEPKTEWISVSKKLPKEAYGCLVTVFDTDVKTQEDFENILPYFVGYDGETWNNADGEPIPFEVIAWTPLPKPYKVESEDNENDTK